MKYRKLGKIGEVSALGFGTMRLPTTDGRVDDDESIRMIRHAIDNGVNYVDTAYFYHNGYSEELVGKALKDGYREKVMLTTKCPLGIVKTAEDFDRVFELQLKRLNTDFIDCYLLHAVNRDKWESIVLKENLLDKIRRLKDTGRVGHIGFSFHDNTAAFKRVIDEFPDCELCQIQLNYIDINSQAGLEGLEYAAGKGIAVVIMEPLLGGKLANAAGRIKEALGKEKTPVEWALDYLWSRKEVSVVLSGMSSFEQVEDNLEYAGRSGIGMLSPEHTRRFVKAKRIYESKTPIACTGCEYCMPCPAGIDIARLFKIYSESRELTYFEAYDLISRIPVPAGACTSCGRCESKCPQALPISRLMQEIDDDYGD